MDNNDDTAFVTLEVKAKDPVFIFNRYSNDTTRYSSHRDAKRFLQRITLCKIFCNDRFLQLPPDKNPRQVSNHYELVLSELQDGHTLGVPPTNLARMLQNHVWPEDMDVFRSFLDYLNNLSDPIVSWKGFIDAVTRVIHNSTEDLDHLTFTFLNEERPSTVKN